MLYNLELLAASCAAINLYRTDQSLAQQYPKYPNKQITRSIFVNKFPATSSSNQFPNHAYSQESLKGGNSHKVAYKFMTSNPNPSAHPLQQCVPALSLTFTMSRKAELKQRLGPSKVKVVLPKVCHPADPSTYSDHIRRHIPEYTRT